MAKIKSITLKNYKGAEDVTIEFSGRVECPVVTLIGLNESGKTTILEGISHFVTGDKDVSSLFKGTHTDAEIESLVPVHKEAAFTGEIKISALVALDDEDYQSAIKVANGQKLHIDREDFPQEITIGRVYVFEDSSLKKTQSTWDIEFSVRPLKGTKSKPYVRPKNGEAPDLWDQITDEIWQTLPDVAYFPTFLVDMPRRIYLKKHDDERPVNRFYRYVFQDILDSLGENLSLEKHVCKRIDEFREKENSPNWFSIFFGGPSKKPIDSVFQKISSAVTREVLGSWRKIFQRNIGAKSIIVEWNIDTEKGNLPYASFVVSDGESRYAISQRSLGFRWFFSFLLFTAFKQSTKQRTLFVFDEPAANLHAKAQAELLQSFSRIVTGSNRIIYSTHSHHMVNPNWLAGAYIVENTALDYDNDDSFGLTTRPTYVKATKYREFVSQYPGRTSYFQPVIESLEYVAPSVLGTAPFVIIEGITDYYAFKFAAVSQKLDTPFSLMPGAGAGSSGPLVSLLMGRGEKFLILLDDDKSGRTAAERYRREWMLSSTTVLTLGELDAKFKDRTLEKLVSPETRQKIQTFNQSTREPSKKEIGLYFAEMCATDGQESAFSKETTENLVAILKLLGERVTALPDAGA